MMPMRYRKRAHTYVVETCADCPAFTGDCELNGMEWCSLAANGAIVKPDGSSMPDACPLLQSPIRIVAKVMVTGRGGGK
jgi:hypothetical protein